MPLCVPLPEPFHFACEHRNMATSRAHRKHLSPTCRTILASLWFRPPLLPPVPRAETIDQISLQGISQHGLETDFVFLCGLCASVVCARVSPRQKSLVVGMVRAASPNAVTLSVGDGANDVPMLQARPSASVDTARSAALEWPNSFRTFLKRVHDVTVHAHG